MTNQRYVCIHGHFYQPPRENPWLEAIELQESAEPFHDWNERITAECYSPNSAARIQDDEGHIMGIINNYARMSFNFGPTLLSWMEKFSPLTYQAILDADKESIDRFGGHGSAMAQVYNHIIMPLANSRDQETQISWGIQDFEYRFGRKPEGMWLAEAAVCIETLELLADNDIKFTVLAPRQAAAVRPMAANGGDVPDAGWEDVSGGRIDPARSYSCPLPSGRSIALFFYDGPISQAVAFEGILNSGEKFASRLLSGFSDDRDYPQLLHIATDGETYGHHHKFGDMALAYALHYIEANDLAKLTNYGEFLEIQPPEWEVRIANNSSWSCIHGVERWASDCGCSSGQHQGWSQQWRNPLRLGLDALRDAINPKFEDVGSKFFKNPWKARDEYVHVIMHRDQDAVDRFMESQAIDKLSGTDLTTALQLMEMQRQLMLMYTSCGWFFDELSGLETVQIMQYASRAIQLAEKCLGVNAEKNFLRHLKQAKSNIAANRDGELIYEKFVKTAQVDLDRVGAHYAVMSLFGQEASTEKIYAFTVERRNWKEYGSVGHSRLILGRARVLSDVTYDWEDITFTVLHLSDHNLSAGVAGIMDDDKFSELTDEVSSAFAESDLPTVIRILDQNFDGLQFSLESLFKDERQAILQEILSGNMKQAESMLRMIFENNAGLLRFINTVNAPQPNILRAIGRFVIGSELRNLLDANVQDSERLLQIVDDAAGWNLPLDGQGVELALNHAIENRTGDLLSNEHEDIEAMQALIAMASLAEHLPFSVNFWQAQNVIFLLIKSTYPAKQKLAKKGNREAGEWIKSFKKLAEKLKVNIDE